MRKEICILIGLIAVFSLALVSGAQAATLEQVVITPGNNYGGIVSHYNIKFIVASSVEKASQVLVKFPAGFTLSSVMSTSTLTAPSTTGTGLLASSAVDVSENSFILYLGGPSAEVTAASETVVVTAGEIQSSYGGGTFTLDVRTRTAAGTAIDQASSSSFRILPADNLESASVDIDSYVAPPTSAI